MTISPEVIIDHIHIGGDGHPDKWYLAVWGKPSTRISMEQLKQQILSNDKIAEFLQDDDFQYELGIFVETDGRMVTNELKEFLAKLQSILQAGGKIIWLK